MRILFSPQLVHTGLTMFSTIRYKGVKKFNFESPLTRLIWLTSFFSIVATFFVSYWQLRALPNNMWLTLSIIVSCGTIGAAVIPELTKVFTDTIKPYKGR